MSELIEDLKRAYKEKLTKLAQGLQQVRNAEMQAHDAAQNIIGRTEEITELLAAIERKEHEQRTVKESDEVEEETEEITELKSE